MARALALAERGLYTTTPNPRVGCVIVAAASVIGEGWHERAGEAHAEVDALRDARARGGATLRGATLYVTLEPCNHAGRTPPCAEALIAAGVARVVAAMADPNPRRPRAARRACAPPASRVDVGLLRGRGARAQPRLRLAHDARPAVGAHEGRREPRRPHGARRRREPVDHRRGGARRRPSLARARLRDPDRHRHRAAGRSAAHRARGGDAAPAAAHRRRPPRARRRATRSVLAAAARWSSRRARATPRGPPTSSTLALPDAQRPRRSARADARAGARAASTSCTSRPARKLNGALLDAGLVDEILLYLAPGAARRPGARHVRSARRRCAALDAARRARVRDVARVGDDLRIRRARRCARGGLMFTGIVQAVGRIAARRRRAATACASSSTPACADARRRRDRRHRSRSTAAASRSSRSNGAHARVRRVARDARAARPASTASGDVNLEKALRLADRLGGHLMTGHVDGVGTVVAYVAVAGDDGGSRRLVVEAPAALARFIARQGLDRRRRREPHGERRRRRRALTSNLIPHTLAATTLGALARRRARQPRDRPHRALRRAAARIRRRDCATPHARRTDAWT